MTKNGIYNAFIKQNGVTFWLSEVLMSLNEIIRFHENSLNRISSGYFPIRWIANTEQSAVVFLYIYDVYHWLVMGKEYDKGDLRRMNQDTGYFRLGFLYWNRWDKMVIVPKRIPALGWTLNFANPVTYIILIVFFALVFFVGRFF